LSLETILGNQRDAVLAHGLGSLSQERLRQLLRHPRLLLDLQELIVSSGRPFWHGRAESALEQAPASDQRAAIDRDWAWLTTNVIDQPAAAVSVPFRPDAIHSSAAPTPARDGTRFRWRLRSMASLAAAAAVILAILTVFRLPGRDQNGNGSGGVGVASPSGWGWNRPEALPQDLSPGAYLNHLADGAQAWLNKRPADRVALIQRITEFREGCTVLIQSPHKPLPAGRPRLARRQVPRLGGQARHPLGGSRIRRSGG
jgi:hypothetical protein